MNGNNGGYTYNNPRERQHLHDMLRMMLLIRRFEEKMRREVRKQSPRLSAPVHRRGSSGGRGHAGAYA